MCPTPYLSHTGSFDDDGDHLSSSEWIRLVVENSEKIPEELRVRGD
jgi:hypothetical protein